MKPVIPKEDGIDAAANRVTRSNSESEDIDLAAEATEGAPAKSLAPQSRSKRAPAKAAKPVAKRAR